MSANVHSYRDLIVWLKSMGLAEMIYASSKHFPADERFGLTQQIRRAAISVPSNIAEGHSRLSTPAFMNHLSIALGSLAELETQFSLAARLGYITTHDETSVLDLTAGLNRMIRALHVKLSSR